MRADPKSEKRLAVRRAAFLLVLAVVIVHALFLGAYEWGNVENATSRYRTIFTTTWMVTTGIVVAVLLRRLRRARFGR